MRRIVAFFGMLAVTVFAQSATISSDSSAIEPSPICRNIGFLPAAVPLARQLEAGRNNPALVGDPTDVTTGMMDTFPQVDFVLPGFSGPFKFSRKYYSLSEYEGPIGYGWTHCLNCTLTRRNDFLFQIMTPEGKFNFFVMLPGSNGFVPITGTASKLVRWTENPNDARPIYKMAWVTEKGTRYIFPDAMRAVMHAPRYLAEIDYGEGRTISFSPGDGSFPTEITASCGWKIRLVYSNGLVTDIYEPGRPDDKPVHFEYENGNLTSVSYPVDPTTTYVRRYFYEDPNDRHNLTRIVFERGDSFHYEYDASDRCIKSYGNEVAGGDGPYFNHAFEYHPDERKTITTRVRGQERFTDVYYYNSADFVVRLDHVDSGITKRYSYDIVPGGSTTIKKEIMNQSEDEHYSKVYFLDEKYDVVGTVRDMRSGGIELGEQQSDDMAGQDQEYSKYPTQPSHLDFQTADFTYNVLDMVSRIYACKDTMTGSVCETITFNYNPDGTLREVRDSMGRKVTYSYDKDGNLTDVSPPGAPEPFMYSLVTLKMVPTPMSEHYQGSFLGVAEEHDWLGRVTEVTYLLDEGVTLCERYEYDAVHLYDEDALYGVNFFATDGRKTQYLYDNAGLLWKVIQDMGEGKTNAVTSLQHDAFGNLISFTDPHGQTTTFAYDSLDRLISVRKPSLQSIPIEFRTAALRTPAAP